MDRSARGRNSVTVILPVLVLILSTCVHSSIPVANGKADHKRVESTSARPNILIIITDDQRDSLEEMSATKRIFKEGGRVFRHAFSAVPNCCPARASIFTGLYVHNHGVTNNTEGNNLDQHKTLQYYLHSAGYKTGIFGKYLNSWSPYRPPPYFTKWAIHQNGTNRYFGGRWGINGTVRTVHRYATHFIESRARKFLQSTEDRDGRPWLLFVPFTAPHPNSYAEPRYVKTPVGHWSPNPAVSEADRSDKPPWVQNHPVPFAESASARRHQLRTLLSVDDSVAELFKTLRELNENHRTLSVFTSDHGNFWGEHSLNEKWLPYSQAVEIPLFMKFPGVVAPGSADDRLISNVDIAPTIMDALDREPSTPMDGRSLLDDGWTRDRVLVEYGGRPNTISPPQDWASTRTLSSVYTEYYNDSGDLDFSEYYDLGSDPWELENLLGDDTPVNDPPVLPLSKQLNDDRSCAGSSCP